MIIYTTMAAITSDDICINRFDDEEYDAFEPFSSVGFYHHDDSNPRFHYVTIDQYVVSITPFLDDRTGLWRFATLSAEGIFRIYEQGKMKVELLISSESRTSSSYGNFRKLRQIGRSFFACGSGGQVYIHQPGSHWVMLTDELLADQRDIANFYTQVPSIGEFNNLGEWQNWMSKNPFPKEIHLCDLNGINEHNVYLISTNGAVFFWNGNNLAQVPTPKNQGLTQILVENEETIWICGHEGVLLRGNCKNGFSQVTAGSQMFLSMTLYMGELFLCSYSHPSALFKFNRLTNQLELIGDVPQVKNLHSIIGIENILWAVGLTDVLRFDGSVWDYIYAQGFREV